MHEHENGAPSGGTSRRQPTPLNEDRRAEKNLELYREINDDSQASVASVASRWLHLAASMHPGVFVVASTQLSIVVLAIAKAPSAWPYALTTALGLSGLMFENFRARNEAKRPNRKGSDQSGGARARP